MSDPTPSVPVVLVHGFASSFDREWLQPGWVDLLRESGRTVVGIDLLGHGSAAKPHDPAEYVNLERSALERFPPEGRVDAVGFSLGARVLLCLAAAHPQRFRRLVLGGVGENLLRADDHGAIARAIEGQGEPEDVMTQAFARFATSGGNDPEALAACMRREQAPLTPALLSQVRAPVLVVLGDRDFAGPGEPLVEALPDARLVTLRGVDHLGTAMDFGFIDAALQFLGTGQ